MEPDAQALVGRRLGEFMVRELLSTGGFGMVFRAEQPALSREAVIKVLHTRLRESSTIVQRFLREAQLSTRLDHPYAAHTYAFGAEPDGVLWIAMELVRGTPLDKLLVAQGPIELARFVPLLEAICEVTHTAHEKGIVHRDLKPANVMVLARAGRLLPKLLDFGIARVMGEAPDEDADPLVPETEPGQGGRLTAQGISMGSPLYMAPEQWDDAANADARSDQYALGVLCYEALTGKPPFLAATRAQLAMAHARQPTPSLGSGFPPALDAVLGRAMAKDAPVRYDSVLELAAAFRRASGIAGEEVTLPRLPETLRKQTVANAPQPLAQAVAALEAARNPHQALVALWQVVRVAVRLLGVTALAGHAHVGAGSSDIPRRLRRRALGDDEWLELARELVAPFAAIRDAHPVPELVAYLCGATPALAELLRLRGAAEESSDEKVRELLDAALPLAAEMLAGLDFFAEYSLVVPGGDGAGAMWMGVRRSVPPRTALRGRAVTAGQPLLADFAGVPVVTLWPFVQVRAPSPGAADALFFLEGKGRRGARLVALPDAFEHDDESLWESLGGMVGETPDSQSPATTEERAPFPGLAAFTRADAAGFLGRERETEAFVNRLRVTPLLAVVGPSGAGKSSFVQAGVLPALPEDWEAITVRPGPAPLAALRARFGDGDLGAALRGRGRPVVLVVDQLEELFTLCDDADERHRYAEALAGAARSVDDPVRVVLTLRDDFLLRAEALPALRTRLAQGLQLLTTPADADLRRIVVESVARAGYELDDPALPGEMVAALAGTPGALALLSFTASKLWELRDRRFRQLSKKAYVSLGGVGGALAHHAEATLEAMPHEEQRLVREVFRHAVTAEGTRAVLSHAELAQVLGGGAHATAVIEKLVAARLLVVSEAEGGKERVEITHEALLDAWPRLVQWRREDAEGARLRDQLRAAARQWDERGRPSGLLWRGDALAEYRLWRARYPGQLTASEDAFAAASLGDAARTRRRRTGLVAAAFLVLAAGVVALLLLNTRAESEKRAAERAATDLQRNLQRQYEDQGRRLVIGGDPLQGLAYLSKAASLGARGPAHDFLVAQAVRATDGELVEVQHQGVVLVARISPDGTRVLTASFDHEARVWDATTGALLVTAKHDDIVTSAAFSPDGRTFVSTSSDGTAVVWDAATGARLHTLTHDDRVRCAEFSPDGATLLTASKDDTVRLWDAATGAVRFVVRGDGGEMRSCAFAPDGRTIAAGDDRGRTRLWSAADGRAGPSLDGDQRVVKTVAFSSDGSRVIAAGRDGTALVWDTASGRRLLTLTHTADVMSAVFSPDGTRIATASNDHTAAIWDTTSGAKLVTLAGHLGGVNRVVFVPDGSRVVTAADDGSVRMWDAASGRPLARWLGHRDLVEDVAIDRAGRRVVSASDDGSAIVWDAAPLEPVTWLAGVGATDVMLARFSPDGSHVVTAAKDGAVRLWDATTGHELIAMLGHDGTVNGVDFSPDGRSIVSAGDDGTVRLWDGRTGAALQVMRGHEAVVNQVLWSPDGASIVSVGNDATIRVWSAGTGALLRSLPGHDGLRITWLAFAAQKTLVTVGDDGKIRLWDLERGVELRAFDGDLGIATIDVDRSGRRATGAVGDRAARIWDLESGERRGELVGHAGQVNAATWSPDGTLIATAAMDGTARIWEASTGDVLAVYPQGRQLWWAAFSPDGRRLLIAGNDTVAIRELPALHISAAKLADLLRCRVPFEIDGDHLRPRERDFAVCRRIRDTR